MEEKPKRKGGRAPIINREMVNETLRRDGFSDPDGMSEYERFDAVLRHLLTSGPRRLKVKPDAKPKGV